MSDRLCTVAGCTRKYCARGMCNTHYVQFMTHGKVGKISPPHGLGKHRMYGAWAGMVNRCHNPNNSSYHQYGARGIYVCDRWRAFPNFLADMGERPEGMTLDRIDPKGPYALENCRWATATEQRANNSDDGKARQREGARAGAHRRWADPEYRKAASETTRKQWVRQRAAK